MTKKNFIALADTIRAQKPIYSPGQDSAIFDHVFCKWADVRDKLADFCAAQNPNFKRERWLDYIAGNCGKNGGKVAKK